MLVNVVATHTKVLSVLFSLAPNLVVRKNVTVSKLLQCQILKNHPHKNLTQSIKKNF